jgi:hypothetical protein
VSEIWDIVEMLSFIVMKLWKDGQNVQNDLINATNTNTSSQGDPTFITTYVTFLSVARKW